VRYGRYHMQRRPVPQHTRKFSGNTNLICQNMLT
jgi:hypothetical protein